MAFRGIPPLPSPHSPVCSPSQTPLAELRPRFLPGPGSEPKIALQRLAGVPGLQSTPGIARARFHGMQVGAGVVRMYRNAAVTGTSDASCGCASSCLQACWACGATPSLSSGLQRFAPPPNGEEYCAKGIIAGLPEDASSPNGTQPFSLPEHCTGTTTSGAAALPWQREMAARAF